MHNSNNSTNLSGDSGTYHPFPEGFCPDVFWDQSATWDTTNPDFTRCFQQTALVWSPCALLWLTIPLQVHYVLTREHRVKRWTWVSLTKMILTGVLVILSLIDFFFVADTWRRNLTDVMSTADLTASLIKTATFLLAAGYIYMDKRRARPSSGILFVFWFLTSIQSVIVFRTTIAFAVNDGVLNHLRFVTLVISFPVAIVQFGLSWFAEYFPELVQDGQKPSPEPLASVPSQVTWSWFNALVYRGWKKPLVQGDLWSLIKQDRAKTNVDTFQKSWTKELEKEKRSKFDMFRSSSTSEYSASLTKSLVRTFGAAFGLAGLYRLLSELLLFVSPQVLRLLIQFVGNRGIEAWKGYLYALIMLVAGVAQCFFSNLFFFEASRSGLQIRGAIMAAVYRKALKITSAAKRSSNVGEIVNLMAVDAQRLNDSMIYFHFLWSSFVSVGLAIYFLWEVLGVSVFAGLGVMVLTIPGNVFIARANEKIQIEAMNQKDARVKLTTEVLNGMKVLKLYAWEESFEQQILDVRERELRQLQRAARLKALSVLNWDLTPFMVAFVSFLTYVLLSPNNILDADTVFVALSLLNLLRLPLTILPHCMTYLVQARVSLGRLTKFLTNDELNHGNVRALCADGNGPVVQIHDGHFAWGKDDSVCLRGINLDIAIQELVAVVGQVGAGKSSLVAAMLGLMEKVSGEVSVRGTVAYVPQQAWIQNLTLKENILFGKSLDEDRYQRVLDACALRPDLVLLAAGDQTEIGEKGANLSGGQRQRVSLARAVYSDADVYFLDDPMSAVDAHVGKHIFEQVVGPNGILKNRTRILVTHGVGYLPQVDKIVVLSGQKISEVGSYTELLQNNGVFAEFLRTYYLDDLEAVQQEDLEGATLEEKTLGKLGNLDGRDGRLRTQSSASTRSSMKAERKVREVFRQDSKSSIRRTENGAVPDKGSRPPQVADGKDDKGRLVEEETSEVGQVKLKVFQTYFKNATYKAALGMIGSYLAYNGLNLGASFWLTDWTEDANIPDRRNDTSWRDYRLAIYAVFGILQALFITAAFLLLAYGQIMASRNLHRSMLARIMRAPMSFFDTTPLGRIVNRFSKDMDTVDSMLPPNLELLIFCVLSVASVLIVISITTPLFTVVIIPLGVFYFFVQRFYITTDRQLTRLEAVSRSPVYSHFQESVQGSSVVWATRQSERFIADNEQRLDANNTCSYASMVSQRWVGIRIDCMGSLVTFFAALFAVLSRDLEGLSVSAEDIGLSISYALTVTQVMNWMVRTISIMENNVVSVERIKEYSEIPNEAPWIVDGQRPEKDWPQSGKVGFSNYQTRYRPDLDLVLRGVDCHIEAGEKIGIVGRTGAGKSSLTLALFRIIEAASGSIVIDGVNIAKFGLQDLRSRITILPQEPVLFGTSLRMNLDPFQTHSDEEIWTALEHSHLRNFVEALPDGLSHSVAEGGENLSVGQRQLICLARALLRKTKILVLDEATAAIDLETDALIQETIREKFGDCTILTIAHRLNTIMDSTRVMVLDAGKIKEFGSPEDLLADHDSIFYSLAKSANLVA